MCSAVKAAARSVDLLPHADFEEAKLKTQREILEDIKRVVAMAFPGVEIEISVKESYRNMRSILDANPLVVDCAMEAVRRSGLEPVLKPIRGGTDGAL